MCRYRRLSLKHHPSKTQGDLAANTYKFAQIAEAYEVLSDPQRKATFDRFGEEILKQGLPDKFGGKKGCYKFAGNSFEIFEAFFGTTNPFFEIIDGTPLTSFNFFLYVLFTFYRHRKRSLWKSIWGRLWRS
jgi:DnaJ-class molecular chaperone